MTDNGILGSEAAQNTDKRLFLEAIRVVAILAVIFIHYHGALYQERRVFSPAYWVYYTIAVFVCFGVAAFFMVSGALLLPKKESIHRIWRHRVAPMFITLVVFSFVQYLWLVLVKGEEAFDLQYFFYRLYRNYWNDTYWFLYTYLAFLILLPLMQKAVSAFSEEYLRYAIGIGVFVEVVYPIGRLLVFKDSTDLSPYFNLWMMGADLIFFPLVGYYIDAHTNTKTELKRWALFSAVAIPVCLLASCAMAIYKYGGGQWGTDVGMHFAVMYGAGVFIIIKYLLSDRCHGGRVMRKVLTIMGRNVFMVYLTHVLIIDALSRTSLLEYTGNLHLNSMISAWLYCTIIMMIGMILGEIWYRIKQGIIQLLYRLYL